MFFRFYSLIITFFLTLCLINTTYSKNNATNSIEKFTKLPIYREMKISPDGKHIVVVFNRNGKDFIGMLDTATLKPVKVFGIRGTTESVGDVYWANNKRLIYTLTRSYSWNKTRFATGELMGVDINGRHHKMIFGYRTGSRNAANGRRIESAPGSHEILDLLPGDDDNILLVFYPWKLKLRGWVYDKHAKPIVYRLNVQTGYKRTEDTLPIPGATAITDKNGKVRFSFGIDDDNKLNIFIKNTKNDHWEDFTVTDTNIQNPLPLSFSQNNKNVYFLANVDNGTRALYIFDLQKKKFRKLYHNKKVDLSFILRDFSGSRVVGVGTEIGLPKYHYLDQQDKKVQLHQLFLRSFQNQDVVVTSATSDAKFIIIFVHSDINSGDYYLINTQTIEARHLINTRPQLNPKNMAHMIPETFTMRDGSAVYGYLTRPVGQEKNLPLVVLPHGGPHGVRDFWRFDWEAQLLASRGYAVLQLNYRGSAGFGKDFEHKGYGQWGALMQDDLTDATRELIKQGVADPKRICIFGSSYGGYAALMGAVKEPELYKCAIGSAGVYDLPMMFKEGDIADNKSGVAYLKEVIGENPDDQKKRSPAYNAAKIKADILIIHGGKDQRAPLQQAKSLKKALDAAGKKYQWFVLPNEGHGYYDESNRLKVYTKVLEFLDNEIGQKI